MLRIWSNRFKAITVNEENQWEMIYNTIFTMLVANVNVGITKILCSLLIELLKSLEGDYIAVRDSI